MPFKEPPHLLTHLKTYHLRSRTPPWMASVHTFSFLLQPWMLCLPITQDCLSKLVLLSFPRGRLLRNFPPKLMKLPVTRHSNRKEFSHPSNLTNFVLQSSAKEVCSCFLFYFFKNCEACNKLLPIFPHVVSVGGRVPFAAALSTPPRSSLRGALAQAGPHLWSALSFHLPQEHISHCERWPKLHSTSRLPFISPSSRCQANSEVKACVFVKQTGVSSVSVFHGDVESWAASHCVSSVFSSGLLPLENLIMPTYMIMGSIRKG